MGDDPTSRAGPMVVVLGHRPGWRGLRPGHQVDDLRQGRRAPAPSASIIRGILEFQTSLNPGALWGFGRTLPYSSQIFAGLSIVAGIAICYWLFVRGAAASLALTIALGLIMAGALGNCYDRLVYGHVRDFVHFHVDSIGFDCAIFNFADNMLVLGAVILVLFALRPEAPAVSDPTAVAPDQASSAVTPESVESIRPA